MLRTLNIQNEIDNLLNEFFPLNSYNLYLVGSRSTKNFSKNSDYDFILYLNNNVGVDNLMFISNILNSYLNWNFKASFKVFDISAFENFYNQDYFRYLEYRLAHKAIKESENIFTINFPKKNNLLIQLANSIIIQYWWSIITIANSTNKKNKIKKKLLLRIQRNINLYNNEVNDKISYSDFINYLSNNNMYKKIRSLNKNNYMLFLNEYFNSFEHEKINKYCLYTQTVISNFQQIKLIAAHLKL